jgi:hypothetical protein
VRTPHLAVIESTRATVHPFLPGLRAVLIVTEFALALFGPGTV